MGFLIYLFIGGGNFCWVFCCVIKDVIFLGLVVGLSVNLYSFVFFFLIVVIIFIFLLYFYGCYVFLGFELKFF